MAAVVILEQSMGNEKKSKFELEFATNIYLHLCQIYSHLKASDLEWQ